MATKLTKDVSREIMLRVGKTESPVSVIITLHPDATVSVRQKSKKRRSAVHIGHIFVLAEIMEANRIFRAADAEYKRKKKLHIRGLRKPKEPFVQTFYNPIYTKALKTIS